MAYENPPIIRPIPRRPFDISLTSPTPPSDSDSPPVSGRSTSPNHLYAKPSNTNLSASNGGTETPTFSRTRSILNLTSSTLFGIYSPTYPEKSTDSENGTSFGNGVLTSHSPASDNIPARPRVSRSQSSQTASNSPLHLRALGFALRTSLLFLLGTVYGLLVTHLHNERRLAPFAADGFIRPSYEAKYFVFWGVAGVAMGSALPWVDAMWEEYFGEDIPDKVVVGKGVDEPQKEEEGVAAQWTPVVRSIGAFVGIAFAIRKLPWTSTLEVSLTLALANPFLWYLLDRSKPGLLLSTTVGLIGTTGILALDSGLVPSPLAVPSGYNSTADAAHGSGFLSEGFLKDKAESAIWITSVLFCSVLCFGHIGRRLALLRRRSRA